MSLESMVVLSALHSQSARQFLHDSLATPQDIAPPPRVCEELARITASPGFDAPQVARIVESEPALAREIMRVANSPATLPRAPAASLGEAVERLGLAEVRQMATAVMLHGDVFIAPGHEPECEELWREASLAGLWAKQIARERRKHADVAFLAAVMHRSGAALSLKTLSRFEAEQRTVMDARSFADLVVEFEPQFGRLLMSSWKLPADVQAGASDWRNYAASLHGDLAATVNAAHLLATHTMYPQLLAAELVIDSPVFEALGMDPDDRRAMLANCDQVRCLAGIRP